MGGQTGPDYPHKQDADVVHERTALLGAQRQQTRLSSRSLSRSPGPYHYETEDDELDEHESELLLARTASISSAVGLAPEASEAAMFQHRQRKMSSATVESPLLEDNTDVDYDAEAAAALATAGKSEKEYLINTDFRRFVVVFISIMLGNFVSIFDGTIMASSHPVITSYFHSSNSASWMSTAFLLTSTAFQPLLGRLSDSFGRKPLYVSTVVIFASATAWCGLADSMESFILARAVCGLGAGGMISLGTIIISDLVPIERRGTYQSYVNVVYGLGSAAGAALGGLMADTLGWRWEFGVQVPAVTLCLVAAVVLIPADIGLQGERDTFMEAMRAFDFKGSILLTASTTFLILGLNLGGNILPWTHPFIITSLLVSAICFPTCLWVESKAKRPIMPLTLLHSPPRANIIFSNFTGSFLLNAILFNAPLYFQAVLLTSATESGALLIIPQVTAAAVGTATGMLITWTRRLKWPLVLGTLLTLLGTVVLSFMQRGWPAWAYLLCLAPSALGQGFHFPGTFLAVLAASPQSEQAVVSSTLVLWRALGAVLGVAGSSLIMQNSLLIFLARYITEEGHPAGWKDAVIQKVRESVEEVAKLEGDVLEQVVLSYEAAIRATFLCCIGAALISVCLILPIRLPRLGARK